MVKRLKAVFKLAIEMNFAKLKNYEIIKLFEKNMAKFEKTNPPAGGAERSKIKYQERTGELTENEKKVLANLLGVVKWFEDYEITCFGLDENVADKDPKLEKYLEDFYKEFRGFEQPAEAQEVETKAKNSDIVFLGDHHNLRRNQEFSAEFIEKILTERKGPQAISGVEISDKATSAPGRLVLALEFISPKYQKAMEDFMSGQIDEVLFLKRSHFLEWGDLEHWPGYKKILETAKKLGIKVYGIRFQAESGEQDLEDKFFAQKIAAIAEKHPQAKLFIHIGNTHLASSHLPKALSQIDWLQNKKNVVVLQNIRPLYFSALKRCKNFQIPKVLKVKDGVYNFVTAPLITEVISDIENLKQFIGKTEGEEDIWADVMGTEIVSRLRKLVGIDVDEKVVDSKEYPPSLFFPSFYSENESGPLLKQLKEKVPADVFGQYIKTLEEKGCVYIPSIETKNKKTQFKNCLIVRRFRLKRIIEELAKFVLDPNGTKGDLSALQYFCSKLFIPERQPENATERKGEKIFIDFLNGKKPLFPR